MLKTFPFLTSNRFWAVVVIAVVMMLYSYGLVPVEVRDLLVTICGAHVGLRTIDRAAEKLGKK